MRRFSLTLSLMVALHLFGCNGSPSSAPDTKSAVPGSAQSESKPTALATGKPDASRAGNHDTANAETATLSRKELVQKILDLRNEALKKSQANKMAAAYELYCESGRLAEELRRRFSELDPQEKMILGNVFYDQACGLAMTDQIPAALQALDRAIAAGWNDLNHMAQDSDLEAVRKLPDFDGKKQMWEQQIAKMAKAAAIEELAHFQSYPFDFTLNDFDANPVKLGDYRGKIVIVDIWGTWCPPCRAEIPSFVKLQKNFGEQGLQIIGLNYEGSKSEEDAITLIRQFQEANNMNYPCLIGDSETRNQVPEFRGYPTTLFIDRTGKVRMQFVGAHPYASLESIVLALLNETST